MRYVLGETLQEYQEEIMEKDRPSVFLATSQTAWNRPACSMKERSI